MIDTQTRSLWSHLLGEAMSGPLAGTRLTQIPSVITDWKSWKAGYPHTTIVVMDRTSLNYTTEAVQGHMGLLIALVGEKQTRVWDFDSFPMGMSAVNDQFEETPVLVVVNTTSMTAVIYNRRLGEEVLEFIVDDGVLRDQQSESTWDMLTGQALSGPKQGITLERMPAIVSDAAAWSLYHPETTRWSP